MAASSGNAVNRLLRDDQALAGSLVDQIWKRLRTAIIHGEIPAGARLVELQIAEEMGTSQGPVREALQRLEQEGLVERRARSATIVTEMPNESIHDLITIRSLVERLAAQRAALRITDDQLNHLRNLIEQMRACARQHNRLALEHLNMEFHLRICRWSGNPLLARLWLPISAQMQRLIAQRPADHVVDLHGYVESHMPIVEALAAHDSQRAAATIAKHIADAWSLIEATEPEDVRSSEEDRDPGRWEHRVEPALANG